MSDRPTIFRFLQFDLRLLFLLVTAVAVWLGWQFRPQRDEAAPLTQMLKVGDRVVLQTNGTGDYELVVPNPNETTAYMGGYPPYNVLKVKRLNRRYATLQGDDHVQVIRLDKVNSITRYKKKPAPVVTASSVPTPYGTTPAPAYYPAPPYPAPPDTSPYGSVEPADPAAIPPRLEGAVEGSTTQSYSR